MACVCCLLTAVSVVALLLPSVLCATSADDPIPYEDLVPGLIAVKLEPGSFRGDEDTDAVITERVGSPW